MIRAKIDDAIEEYENAGGYPGDVCLVMTREAFTQLAMELRAYTPMGLRQRIEEPDKTFDEMLKKYRNGFATAVNHGLMLAMYDGIEIRPAEFGEGWAIVRKNFSNLGTVATFFVLQLL